MIVLEILILDLGVLFVCLFPQLGGESVKAVIKQRKNNLIHFCYLTFII